jgi:YD repeat-containing protein
METRRNFIIKTSLGSLGIIALGCKSDDGGQPLIEDAKFIYFTDPNIDAIANTTNEFGESITLSGSKSATGIPTNINQVSITTPSNQTAIVNYDSDGRVVEISDSEEGLVQISYPEPGRTLFTFRSLDGIDTLQFPIEELGVQKQSVTSKRSGAVPNIDLQFGLKNFESGLIKNTGVITVSCDENGSVPISGAVAYLNQTFPVPAPGIAPKYITVTPLEVSPGIFEYSTIDTTQAPTDAEEIAQVIFDVVNEFCGVPNQLIKAKADEIAEEVVKNIPKISKAAVLKIIGRANVACNAYTVGDFLVQNLEEFTGTLVNENGSSVLPYAKHPSLGWIYGESVPFSPGGDLPTIVLSYNQSANRLDPISVSPIDPNPNQGYVFGTKSICAQIGGFIRLTIVGTDGYADQRIYPINSSAEEASLNVPGAAAGVKDVLTAEIFDASQNQVGDTLTTQIIF